METHDFQKPITALVTQGGEVYTYNQSTVRMPNGPRIRQVMDNPYPSNTIDSAGNDTDVNIIMARFERTGILPPATVEPVYADVVDLQGDLTEISQRAAEALAIANKFAETWTQDQAEKAAAAAAASPPEPTLSTAPPASNPLSE